MFTDFCEDDAGPDLGLTYLEAIPKRPQCNEDASKVKESLVDLDFIEGSYQLNTGHYSLPYSAYDSNFG